MYDAKTFYLNILYSIIQYGKFTGDMREAICDEALRVRTNYCYGAWKLYR